MCGGVSYQREGEMRKVYFPQNDACLPVLLKGGEGAEALLPWGRREWESGRLPATGWARLESIQAGKWDRYRPVPVQIPVEQFMEKDREGEAHWFSLEPGQVIQGALARVDDEQRVYVVTLTPEGALAAIHDRWPRIVSRPGAGLSAGGEAAP
jgi:putative SOS response-associated peptidase YedK